MSTQKAMTPEEVAAHNVNVQQQAANAAAAQPGQQVLAQSTPMVPNALSDDGGLLPMDTGS